MPNRPPIHRPPVCRAPRFNARGKDATNRQRTRAFHTGSKAWKQMRDETLLRDSYTCCDCGCYGDQVDHDDGNSHNNAPGNLKTRCIHCHSAKTRREQNRKERQT